MSDKCNINILLLQKIHMDAKKLKATDPYQKICLYKYCGASFKAKRTNQDYCCSGHRIKANNDIARDERKATGRYDLQLKKNRRVLNSFFLEGKTEISLRELEFNGFNYEVTTKVRFGQGSVINELCYFEFKLIKKDQNNFKILKP